MMKIIISILLSFLTLNMSAKNKNEYRYEVIPIAVGTEGTALIKVYSYAKSQKKAIDLGKRNAVHALLFKGIPGGNGVYYTPPLVKPGEHELYVKFFDNFFESGDYLRFVTLSSDGIVDPEDMLRVGSEYKIGIVFAVSKNELRKYLEDNGIIKKLGDMF